MSAASASVTLSGADGSDRKLTARRDTWILIHGLGGSKADMKRLATAVDAASTKDQVLLLDWSKLAATTDTTRAVANTQVVADTVADRIRALGLPASRLNLIGFSLGGLVAARIAKDLHATGGVNRIIALDPAAPRTGGGKRATLKLAEDSRYSIVFCAQNSYSTAAACISSDATVLLTNVGSNPLQRHGNVLNVFTSITEQNNAGGNALTRVFSLKRISTGGLPPWKKNAYPDGFEAMIDVKKTTKAHLAASLQYRAGGKTRTVVGP